VCVLCFGALYWLCFVRKCISCFAVDEIVLWGASGFVVLSVGVRVIIAGERR